MANRIANKILLVGWDGADWRQCQPLLAEGQMPNLQRLIAHGARGTLRSVVPILSPPAWTSIATGKRPHKHGVHGLFEPDEQLGGIRPVSSESRTTKSLWNILSENHLAVHVIGWPASQPAEPINGIMATDRHAAARVDFGKPWPQPEGSVHPPELRPQLASLRLHPDQLDQETLSFFVPSVSALGMSGSSRLSRLKASLAATVTTHAAATWAMENRRWDVAAVCYPAIEQLSHVYGRYLPPEDDRNTSASDSPFHQVVPAAYRFQDMMLGRLLELAGDDAVVLLLSDHGAKCREFLSRGHAQEPENVELLHTAHALCVVSGPQVKTGAAIQHGSILDVAPTILALLGLPRGADMDGRPLVELFNPPLASAAIASWDNPRESTQANATQAREEADHLLLLLAELKQAGFADPQEENLAEQQQRVIAKNRFLLARSLLDAGQIDQARSILAELHVASPTEAPIAEMLVETLLIDGQSASAYEVLAALPDETGDPAWRRLTLGRIQLNRRRPHEALAHLLHAQQAAPANIRPRVFLGQAYLALRRWADARQAFNAALAIEPNHPEALFGLTIVANKQKNFQEAIALATQALASQQLPLGYYHRGYAFMKMGRPIEAAADFESVKRLLPDFPPLQRMFERIKRYFPPAQ